MREFLSKPSLKVIFTALIVIGIGLLILGAAGALTTQYTMGGELAERMILQEQAQASDATMRDTYAQMLFAADRQIMALEENFNRSAIVAGAGLILIALGWIAREIGRGKPNV